VHTVDKVEELVVSIEEATEKDADGVRRVFDTSARSGETGFLRSGLIINAIRKGCVKVAKIGEEVIGAIIYSCKMPINIGFVSVLPPYRGKGVGAMLVNECAKGPAIAKITEESLGFWLKLGFKPVKRGLLSKGGRRLIKVERRPEYDLKELEDYIKRKRTISRVTYEGGDLILIDSLQTVRIRKGGSVIATSKDMQRIYSRLMYGFFRGE
jgi:predicted N-acetyltransferase YhbS